MAINGQGHAGASRPGVSARAAPAVLAPRHPLDCSRAPTTGGGDGRVGPRRSVSSPPGAVRACPDDPLEASGLRDLGQVHASRMEGAEAKFSETKTKRVVFIRHGISAWNEFLGAHKRNEWEEQEKLRKQGRAKGFLDEDDGQAKGFWKNMRSGLKHVANAATHAGKLNQVDHQLSLAGMSQARALRDRIAQAVASDGREEDEDALLECEFWLISPFLRALQTAAFVLAPLHRLHPNMNMRLTSTVREIVNSAYSSDCQGKRGNLGFKVVARALEKITESMQEEDEDPSSRARQVPNSERCSELVEVTNTLCAMNIDEVQQVWWTDVGAFKKEHLVHEDARVKKLVYTLLKNEASVVGVVAHSLLMQRIMQLFSPLDEASQNAIREGLKNGGPAGSRDIFQDKIMNCGTLVLTFKYRNLKDVSGGQVTRNEVEIVRARFLFGGRMESAQPVERQSLELPEGCHMVEFEDLNSFIGEASPPRV